MKTKVLLADDHPPLVDAALAILKPPYDIVGIATDGAMLVSEALRLSPDLIVSDVSLNRGRSLRIASSKAIICAVSNSEPIGRTESLPP